MLQLLTAERFMPLVLHVELLHLIQDKVFHIFKHETLPIDLAEYATGNLLVIQKDNMQRSLKHLGFSVLYAFP